MTPHWYCWKNSDWFTLWLDIKQLLPLEVECWAENIKIIYDQNLFPQNNQGVEIRVPYFGKVIYLIFNTILIG
jgi:lysophospholipase-3